MSSFGVSSDGFGLKTQEDVENEIKTEQQNASALPTVIDQSPDSPLGQLNGAVSLQLAELWEVAQAIYRAGDPSLASGNALSLLARLTGTIPKDATKATVTLNVNLDASITLPVGRLVSSSVDSSVLFVTTAAVTSTTAGNYSVAAEAQEAGALASSAIAPATLTVIETPATGWNSVTNASAATNGAAAEDDTTLRQRRADELSGQGATTIDAITTALSALTTVTDARTFENTTLVTDGDGVPGKAFEAVVESSGSDDDDIAQAIWDNKPAGIQAHGIETGNATDIEGGTRVINFTRATQATVGIEVDIVIDSNAYPATGDDDIKAAIIAVVNTLGIGDDVYKSPLIVATMSIAGVVNVDALRMAADAPPVEVDSISIDSRDIARTSTSNITVTQV